MSTYRYRGGRLRRWPELSRNQRVSLLFDLINAISLIKNPTESAYFLTDLLTADEIKILSKRLRVAKLILKNWSYEDISSYLKVSPNTIAKVSAWLKEHGETLRQVLGKLSEERLPKRGSDFPKYAWPLKLLEDLDKEAAKSADRELHGFLNRLDDKEIIRHQIQDGLRKELRDKKAKR